MFFEKSRYMNHAWHQSLRKRARGEGKRESPMVLLARKFPRARPQFVASVLALCNIWTIGACRPDVEPVVRARVDEQVRLARKKAQQRCDENLYAEAERIADSILLYSSRPAWADSLAPGRPARPIPPPRLAPIDSEAVRPIFED